MEKKTVIKKNQEGYGYKYSDLSQIHEYLESNDLRYYQFIKNLDGVDYIFTQKQILKDDKYVNDGEPVQGCRVVQAILSGKSNPAQEQGSALTYARRYSLLMAYGLSTEDDDAESLTTNKITPKQTYTQPKTDTISGVTETHLRKFIAEQNIANEKVISTLQKFNKNKLIELHDSEVEDFKKGLTNGN